ncbi:hypothetical protein KZJ38_07185 [Paraburkholderia edwinii]|uniref:Uncharacterized protein n=1 Tax=Paraburkholderia edwinii TaxID=2861782 RepID=A0ABX8UT81_9BURK|nr:hypothetical protein [Paraburkholderia edwinii]QYD70088.1 hypothetical protein KZJ38_07185 [Paraburkholderia edwinii]
MDPDEEAARRACEADRHIASLNAQVTWHRLIQRLRSVDDVQQFIDGTNADMLEREADRWRALRLAWGARMARRRPDPSCAD